MVRFGYMLKAEATLFVAGLDVGCAKGCFQGLWMARENGRMELPFTLGKSCTHYAPRRGAGLGHEK